VGVEGTSFAGNNEDTATNLYDAQFREYGIQGRWPSPDPAGIAAADPANPQSWNRYAYSLNNPLTLIDPSGKNPGLASNCQAQVETCDTGSGGVPAEMYGGGSGGGDTFGDTFGCDKFDLIDPNSFCSQIMMPIINGTYTLANWNNYYPSTIGYQFTGGDGSILEQQEETAAIQLGELDCAGEDPSAIASCIQDAYNGLYDNYQGNPQGPSEPELNGGNYDFDISAVQINGQGIDPSSFGCFASRCGAFDSLDFSHGDGTFHVDTATVWGMLGLGAIVHLGWDVIGGNAWWKNNGIPRPWW